MEQHFNRVSHLMDDPKYRAPGVVASIVERAMTDQGRARIREAQIESANKHGVLCLAEDATNMLLWSYYAEGHSGVAIRFKTTQHALAELGEMHPQFIPLRVRYQTEFASATSYFVDGSVERVCALFGTKSSAWKHEQEWRIVLTDRHGYQPIPLSMIDGVIFGLRTGIEAEQVIRGWLSGRESPVELMRVIHQPYSFELEVVPVN